MHLNTLRALAISFVAATVAVGCGKGSVPAEDTTAKKEDTKAKAEPEAASEDSKKDEKGAESKPKKKDDGFNIERKAKDYITAPDVVFMYAFKESDPGIKAEKACEEKSKGDNEKKAKCVKSAQSSLGFDGYHFEQNDSGVWYWNVVKIKNGVVNYLHKVPIEFAKETDKTVDVKVIGKDEAKGAKGGLPSEVTFEAPNAYQIVQTDSNDGKLVFEAKLGLLGDPATRKKR